MGHFQSRLNMYLMVFIGPPPEIMFLPNGWFCFNRPDLPTKVTGRKFVIYDPYLRLQDFMQDPL